MGELASSDLVVEIDDGPPVTFRVAGDVDIESSPRLRSAVDDVIGRGGVAAVRFDLSAVEFLDSSGLAVLIAAENAGAQVSVCVPSPAARLAITACGLDHLLSDA